jgi:hypothetical protein
MRSSWSSRVPISGRAVREACQPNRVTSTCRLTRALARDRCHAIEHHLDAVRIDGDVEQRFDQEIRGRAIADEIQYIDSGEHLGSRRAEVVRLHGRAGLMIGEPAGQAQGGCSFVVNDRMEWSVRWGPPSDVPPAVVGCGAPATLQRSSAH